MSREDTVKILKECDSGVKMALDSLHDVADKTKSQELRAVLQKSIYDHEAIELDISRQLCECGAEGKEPNVAAKAMSHAKTAAKMLVDNDDSTIADLMTDGCGMGIKKVSEYINMYPNADMSAKNTAEKLIRCEQELADNLRGFL